MIQRTPSILGALVQCSALALVLAIPAMAQELPTALYWEDDAKHQALKNDTISVQTLTRTHEALVSRLGKLSYTADSAGNSIMPTLLAHLMNNASLSNYKGNDAPYLPEAAREWNIRHRVCVLPEDPSQFAILSWLEIETFRRGAGAREIQAAPRAYYEATNGNFDSFGQIGIMLPKGRGGSALKLQYGYQPFAGDERLVPDCLVGTTLGQWPDGSVLPNYEAATVLTYVTLPNLTLNWRESREIRAGQCPPASSPELTIAAGKQVEETRVSRTLIDRSGRPVLKADGTAVPPKVTDWTYESGCRAPRQNTVTVLEPCKYMSHGIELTGQRGYLVDTYEAVPPAPYPNVSGYGNEKWIILPGTTPRLFLNTCSGAGALPKLDTRVIQEVISEPLSCTAVYPSPEQPTNIAYSLGSIGRKRTRSTYQTTFPASSGLAPVSAVTYSPWSLAPDSCHRILVQNSPESNTQTCPTGYTGSITQSRTRTVTTTDFANPASADTSVSSYSAWATVANTCTVVRASGGGGGGGGGERSLDVDGDGRGDFGTASEAAAAGFTGNNGVPGNYPSVSNYGRSAAVQSQVDHSRSSGGNSSGNGGGGWGGCFLTTAVTERRGEADDGPTLTTLRDFRDGYMAALPEGPALIKEYYRDAPRIVAAIPSDHADWDWIATQVDAACEAIRADQPGHALEIYSAMVRRLQATWL